MTEILKWVGMVANYGQWLKTGVKEGFQIPVIEGPKRARHLEPEFKEAVVDMGASGELFSSNAHCAKVLRKFKLARGLLAFKKANEWNNASMARYLCGARRALHGKHGRVISLSWDGTGLSFQEFLFAVMQANGKACVCPPMVPSRCHCRPRGLQIGPLSRCKFGVPN